MNHRFPRRQLLAGTVAGSLGACVATSSARAAEPTTYRYCLNMSTIRGQNLDAAAEVEIAARAGYDAIEPWLNKLNQYVEGGGSLRDLRKRLEDHGLTVESAIGFARWIVDDEAERQAGLEQARRDMDIIAQLGGRRIAAPPAGVQGGQTIALAKVAERYRVLLEVGEGLGVVPQVEMWGGNPVIGRVSDAITVAIESGHPQACFLGDVYHTYKGGCDFDGLRLLGPQALQVFHMNDYPADPPQQTIRDEHRVYPGDGIAPLSQILQGFRDVQARPVLSLELFNRQYWEQDPLTVARVGLEKMQQAVARAFA